MKSNRGFSLIELMLALALGVVVTAGIVSLFVGNNQTYTLLSGQSRMQENARFAVDFIGRSARAAGYRGCAPEADKIFKTLNGAWNQLFEFDITTPIQAFNYTGTGVTVNDWTPALTNLPRKGAPGSIDLTSGVDAAKLAPNSDILVLRHVEVPGVRIAAIVQSDQAPTVEVPAGGLNFSDGQFVAINNCEQATVFRLGQIVSPSGPIATLRRDGASVGAGLYQNVGAAVSLSPSGVPYGQANNAQGSAVGRVMTEIYYVAQAPDPTNPAVQRTNNRNQGVWSLWRKTSEDPPVELIEGVEALKVLFGIDTTPGNNVNAANQYVTFNNVGANAIRALRVAVTSDSIDVVGDGATPLKRTFSQTVSFRN